MSDERFALSPSATPLPTGADYDAIFSAVMETVRGRWFLTEYARRNRNADTELILAALERATASMGERRPAASPGEQLRIDLVAMAKAIAETRREIAAIRPDDGDNKGTLSEASEELDSIVQTTARATSDILAAAEQVQEIAWTLRERGADGEACDALDRRATDIYTACSFQDLTGQRTRKVVEVMHFLEERIRAMIEIWGDDEPELAAPTDASPVPHIHDDPAVAHLDQPGIDRMMPEQSATHPAGESAHDAVVWASGATPDHAELSAEGAEVPAPAPTATAGAAVLDQSPPEAAPIEAARTQRPEPAAVAPRSTPRGDAALTLVLPDIPVPNEKPRAEPPRSEPPRSEFPRTEPPRTESSRTESPRTELRRTEPPPAAAAVFGESPISFSQAFGGMRADQITAPSFGLAPGADVARISAAADIDDYTAANPASSRLADDPDDILMPLPGSVSVAAAVDEMLMSSTPSRRDAPASGPRPVPPFAPLEIVDETYYASRPAARAIEPPLPAPSVRSLAIVPPAATPIVHDAPVVASPPEPTPAAQLIVLTDRPIIIEAPDITVATSSTSPAAAIATSMPAAVEATEPVAAEATPVAAEPPTREEEVAAAAAVPPDEQPPAVAADAPAEPTEQATPVTAAMPAQRAVEATAKVAAEEAAEAAAAVAAPIESAPMQAAPAVQAAPVTVIEPAPEEAAAPPEPAAPAVDSAAPARVVAPALAPSNPPAPVALEPAPAIMVVPNAPPVQTAAVLAVPPKPATRRIEALAAIAALSEDEKIALFS